MSIVVNVNSFSYQYPTGTKKALDKICLQVESGDFLSVIGLNGSGKTTLCNLLFGFVPQFYRGRYKGSATVCGLDVITTSVGEISKKVGYVFQNPFMQMSGSAETVYEEIAFGLENLGWNQLRIIERVDEMLETLKIEYLKDRDPMALSGGQQQRVAFASILAMDPDVFIMDEPTSQLDPQGTEEVFNIIIGLKRIKKTIILVEHKMDLIAQFSNKILLLEDGSVKKFGLSEDILSDASLIPHGLRMPDFAYMGYLLKQKNVVVNKVPLLLEEAKDLVLQTLSELEK